MSTHSDAFNRRQAVYHPFAFLLPDHYDSIVIWYSSVAGLARIFMAFRKTLDYMYMYMYSGTVDTVDRGHNGSHDIMISTRACAVLACRL